MRIRVEKKWGVCRIFFQCPGCGHEHHFNTEATREYLEEYKRIRGTDFPIWTWNSDLALPTFQPSLLNRWKFTVPDKPEKVCHLFLTNGQIQFLTDCTHALAGQTVELPEMK